MSTRFPPGLSGDYTPWEGGNSGRRWKDTRLKGIKEGQIERRGSDSNRRIKVLQTSPLATWVPRPIHQRYAAQTMERAMGLEPTAFCMASRRSTTELRPHEHYLTMLWFKLTKSGKSVNTFAAAPEAPRAPFKPLLSGAESGPLISSGLDIRSRRYRGRKGF